ncbi:hypothetical protein B0H19DRAFT_1065696 [Mycena capillaripes]|nr:hypothetical protein B0H19DRAFT_1065696 [Mycena capillaripes]
MTQECRPAAKGISLACSPVLSVDPAKDIDYEYEWNRQGIAPICTGRSPPQFAGWKSHLGSPLTYEAVTNTPGIFTRKHTAIETAPACTRREGRLSGERRGRKRNEDGGLQRAGYEVKGAVELGTQRKCSAHLALVYGAVFLIAAWVAKAPWTQLRLQCASRAWRSAHQEQACQRVGNAVDGAVLAFL